MSKTSEVDGVDPYHTSDDSDADPDYSQSNSDTENGVNLQNNNNEVEPLLQKGKKRIIAVSRASGNIVSKHDIRGKHSNRPNMLTADVVATVRKHIECFPPRESHYSRSESQHFNLSFGFPRSDTCSTCDMINVQIEAASNGKEKQCILQKKELHLRKAQAFYDDLKVKIQLAETHPTVETLCFDYEQNLPVPLLTTCDIFYAQQLWVFNQVFHSCSGKKVVTYMFDETIGKKECIETVSFLKHYIEKYLRKSVTTLHIFTDNCEGQNKNAVVLHFLCL
ncbi:hypothetical protein ILUMI_02328 [Ignelater luminosus]|uniref:Uncharacterized protein n=1 Tax=Ignelater luminosus TaxID=2038154 RepID=A0A8K0DDM7_IGNLU|nr:hypothetical protein ILUMI_02328 [Ignelater luminosus]